MSRMWLKNGRAVLADGRAVLCDECPCDQGCRYTYYVDHSLAESGDGHSWETAFNSVNDVFNSTEIHNYRLSGCLIKVYVRGNIAYTVSGTHLRAGSIAFPRISFYPDSSNGRIICTTDACPIGATGVNFTRFDFYSRMSIGTNAECIYGGYEDFNDCTFNAYTVEPTDKGGASVFMNSSYIHLIACTINVTASKNGGGYSSEIFNGGAYFNIENCVINMQITQLREYNSPDESVGIMLNSAGANSIFDDVEINIAINGYISLLDCTVFRSFSGVLSGVTINKTITSKKGDFLYSICNYARAVVNGDITFYDSSPQECLTNKPVSSYECPYDCPDLS